VAPVRNHLSDQRKPSQDRMDLFIVVLGRPAPFLEGSLSPSEYNWPTVVDRFKSVGSVYVKRIVQGVRSTSEANDDIGFGRKGSGVRKWPTLGL